MNLPDSHTGVTGMGHHTLCMVAEPRALCMLDGYPSRMLDQTVTPPVTVIIPSALVTAF